MTRPTASRVCPECTVERPLQQFRRWHGAHRTLHAVCNVCRPERKLSDMTERERADVIALRKPAMHAIERAQRAVEYRKRVMVGDAMRRTNHIRKLERIRNWNEAVGHALREELNTATRKRDEYMQMAAEYHNPNPSQRPSPAKSAARVRFGCWAADSWVPFYIRYVEILTRIKNEVQRRAHTRGALIKPTEEETKLETYITPTELLELRDLYSRGSVIPGIRSRTPWVIAGRHAKGKRRGKSEIKTGSA